MMHRVKQYSSLLCLAVFVLNPLFQLSSYGDVRVEFTGVPPKPTFYNTTNAAWQIGGWRFFTNSDHWKSVGTDGDNGMIIHGDRTINSQIETEAVFGRNASPDIVKLPISTTGYWNNVAYKWSATLKEQATNPYILLKTGSAGKPDWPISEKPITLKQIDSLLKLPDFYNPDYRYKINGIPYYDSLGVLGGLYSGGFLDTWRGQTQVQIALDHKQFRISNTPVSYDGRAADGPLYWMSLAMGQEYFNLDMQWQIGFGGKETMAGLWNHDANGPAFNAANEQGVFQVEPPTGCDRALAYPVFFPPYSSQLSIARNVTDFERLAGISKENFQKFYFGPDRMKINTAWVVNALVVSAVVQYANYNVFSYAEDVCWKEFLSQAVDRNAGIVAMMVYYNLGLWAGQSVANMLKVGSFERLLNDPNAKMQFPEGNNNYRTDLLTLINALVGASRSSVSDKSVEIYDAAITKADLLRLFFGDNGTVAQQGDGGLLKHFTVDRAAIGATLEAAFDKLKGRAPTVTGKDAVSLRYDFLTILRTVKQYFDCQKLMDRPAGGDCVDRIIFNSKIGGCNGNLPIDENYPYLDVMTMKAQGEDYAVEVIVDDKQEVKEVQWTLHYHWPYWFKAEPQSGGSKTQKRFSFVMTKKQIDEHLSLADGQSGKNVWIMAGDGSGNSIVRRYPLTLPPTIDSSIAVDTIGTGDATKIRAYVAKNNSSQGIDAFDSLQYSWPNLPPPLVIVDKKDVGVFGNCLTLNNQPLKGGAGRGRISIRYGLNTIAADIADRVGPALRDEALLFNKNGGTSLDTLQVTFTEQIQEPLADNSTYLQFNKSGAKASLHAQKKGDNTWTFFFPANTVAGNDSVSLVIASGLSDNPGNPPHEKNRRVPIKVLGSKEPRWNIGYIQDVIGRGFGSRITAVVERGTAPDADKVSDCSAFSYSWPTQNNLIASDMKQVTITANSLVVTDSSFTDGKGKGLAVLRFPSDSAVRGPLIDSVGPAIRSALLYETIGTTELDTLIITLTEPIKNNLKNNWEYLKVNGTAVASLTARKMGSDAVWLFVFANHSVVEGDLVNLVHTSGIVDQAFDGDIEHNPPLPNNVQIKVVVAKKKFSVVDGGYHDVNADGRMDRVSLTLNKPIDRQALDTMAFSCPWPQNAPTGQIVRLKASGRDFFIDGANSSKVYWNIPNTEPVRGDLTSVSLSWGRASLTQPDMISGTMVTDSIQLQDSMAAVIVSADYFDFGTSPRQDSLMVFFSEPVKTVSATEPFLFLAIPEAIRYRTVLQQVSQSGEMLTFRVTGSPDLIAVTPKDSLWIAAGNAVSDVLGNNQLNANNIKRQLRFREIFSLVSAAYFDTDVQPDGFIDRIAVRLSGTPSQTLIESLPALVELPSKRGFAPLKVNDFKQIDHGFTIDVTVVGIQTPITAVDSLDRLLIKNRATTTLRSPDGIMILPGRVKIQDSLAPVITRAQFIPGLITTDNAEQNIVDTLAVQFSEEVIVPDQQEPFLYKRSSASGGQTYAMKIQRMASTEKTSNSTRFTVFDKTLFPQKNDSLWVCGQTLLCDAAGIQQTHATKPRLLEVGDYHYVFTLNAFPNPLIRTSPQQLSEKNWVAQALALSKSNPGEHEILFILKPYGFVNTQIVTVQAELMVLDALGNQLLSRAVLEYNGVDTPKKQAWSYVWNTANSTSGHGRSVGTGTYYAIVAIRQLQLSSGQRSEGSPVRIMIGIGE
ncbi:MAG: hypothetical protein JW795_23110 [Chitinivibrionales bacterium]|nr:hypothetical protein [Chitinivibrionales bacterium]